MTRARLALGLVVLAAVCGPEAAAPAAGGTHPARAQAAATSSLASQVVAALNDVRAEHGLAPLRVSSGLATAAGIHSREMARDGYFDHRSADGSAFWKRVERYYPEGSARFWSVGENLLWSSPGIDAPGAVRMWMASAAHRHNMLDRRWREIGISTLHVAAAPGVYKGLEVTLVTADFGVRR